eukprot:jgi/Astpho2/9638/fgenesh1_pm.00146_%23_24_t
MDPQTLVQTLSACLSPVQADRKAAEAQLAQVQHAPGTLTNLLRVAVEGSLPVEVRQQAAIQVKNVSKRAWEATGDEPRLSEQDKSAVRDNLLEGVTRSPPLISTQLAECFKSIALCDYPSQWSGLLPAVVAKLQAKDPQSLHGGLVALRILTRKYEFRTEDDKGPLLEIVDGTFTLVLQLFQHCLDLNSPDPGVGELLKLVCKAFYSATYMGVPPYLLRPHPFAQWMTCFHTLLLRPVPKEGQPEDLDERQAWVWWKVKKWVLHITHRLFKRYADIKAVNNELEKAFAHLWIRDCNIRFLEGHMQLAAALSQGEWMSARCINLLLMYLTHAVALSATWKVMKPHIHQLVVSCIFPMTCFDDEDQMLWDEDPHEYIRKGYDIVEDMYSPKTAAANFIHELGKSRAKGHLPMLMELVQKAFQDYLEQYAMQLEPMLAQCVLPLFKSPYGFVRAKACWVAGLFADIGFREGQSPTGTFVQLFQEVFHLLRDPELPVRVDAVVALRNFIDAFDEGHIDTVKPLIPQLLDSVFNLMQQIESEDLLFTLETVVEKFGEEIAPYAVGLCQHLAAAFWRIQGSGAEDEDDDFGALAAFGCLRAISTVLESVSTLTHLFPQLEEILFPIMHKMCSQDGQDVFEEVLQIISYCTYFCEEISERMWTLWPRICEAFNTWAIDYFDNILVPLDNFISRDTDRFLAGQSPNYLQQANEMARRVLADTETSEGDLAPAPKLLEIILQNCRGRVDHCVAPYLQMVVTRLQSVQRKSVRDLLVNLVATALHYNAEIAVAALQQQGQLATILSTWFQMIFASRSSGLPVHFKRLYDKKVSLLGLTALMGLPDRQVPPGLAQNWQQVTLGILQLLVNYREQQAREAKGEDTQLAASDNEDLDAGELSDSEDQLDENAVLSKLADEAIRFHEEREAEQESGEDSDEWTDEEDADTPIDELDPFMLFSNTLQQLQTQNPGRFQALTSGLPQDRAATLQGALQHADTLRPQKPHLMDMHLLIT